MEQVKLVNSRIDKGLSTKKMAELMDMSELSYKRRENGQIKISHKEWDKLTQILDVKFEDIVETKHQQDINIHNASGQVNTVYNTYYYNFPKEMIETQQEYIQLLKVEISKLKKENLQFKKSLKQLNNK